MIPSDIAVIEQRLAGNDEWQAVAYVGPDRTEGALELQPGAEVRVRYLNRRSQVDLGGLLLVGGRLNLP